MVDLRTYIFIDQLQLQMASYIAMVSRGYFPVAGQASCVIEISPGIEINRLTDIAVKATDVKPGLQIVERLFGLLEVHSHNQGDACATLPDSVLAASQRTVDGQPPAGGQSLRCVALPGDRAAIVACEYHKGIVGNSHLIKGIEDPTDRPVKLVYEIPLWANPAGAGPFD